MEEKKIHTDVLGGYKIDEENSTFKDIISKK